MKIKILSGLVILALCSITRAVSPPMDSPTSFSNTAYGNYDTATGAFALRNNTTGTYNTANGYAALYTNTHGSNNTATGIGALMQNDANNNTADGYQAFGSNTVCINNTATGFLALFASRFGDDNTATRRKALYGNTFGSHNTAAGYGTLYTNFTRDFNTALGFEVLLNNTSAGNNAGVGSWALFNNTEGSDNSTLGSSALFYNTTGFDNTVVGNVAGINVTTADYVICVGSLGANVSNSCFIGNIRGLTTTYQDAIPVYIDSAGQLDTVGSSRRFKKEIKPMGKASESILGLKPVMFHYKSDSNCTPQFGLIAEEVAQSNPDLVVREQSGEIYTARYDAVNAMSLNEFLKEHQTVQELKASAAKTRKANPSSHFGSSEGHYANRGKQFLPENSSQ